MALGGMGTDEDDLTRIITTRAEVDLKLIKEAYQKRNSVPLERAVAKDTTRDYEDILLALLGAELGLRRRASAFSTISCVPPCLMGR